MPKIEIGTFEQVSVRSVWPKEAGDFTPWLAENVELMSDALGMELELEGQEVSVGAYSADLVFRDLPSDALVVVENMYGSTDHDHLGKLITYAAGLDASYAVLLTETFRAEHRSALNWLNSISTEGCGFFGLSLEVWRIAGSIPAPRLRVDVQPDDWSKPGSTVLGGWWVLAGGGGALVGVGRRCWVGVVLGGGGGGCVFAGVGGFGARRGAWGPLGGRWFRGVLWGLDEQRQVAGVREGGVEGVRPGPVGGQAQDAAPAVVDDAPG